MPTVPSLLSTSTKVHIAGPNHPALFVSKSSNIEVFVTRFRLSVIGSRENPIFLTVIREIFISNLLSQAYCVCLKRRGRPDSDSGSQGHTAAGIYRPLCESDYRPSRLPSRSLQ